MLQFHHIKDDNAWAQFDAVGVARKALGFDRDDTLIEIFLDFEDEDYDKYTTLADLDPDWLREDQVISIDASRIPGFVNTTDQDSYTARAEFRNGNEELTIYTANRTRLEEAVGVDLVIINEVLGNVVMIQYKMLEMVGGKGKINWIYRPDAQLDAELKRMEIWDPSGNADDYRMLRDPFYFKFVTRRTIEKKPDAFYMPKDHFNMVHRDPKMHRPCEGVRIDRQKLRNSCLRSEVMLGLIRSGYVGTHGVEKDEIVEHIDGMASNQKAYVIAWKRRLRQEVG